MIADLKPYEEYKESGLSWLEQVPSHWEMRRSKYLFREVDQRSVAGAETRLSMSQRHGLIPSSQIEERRLVSESNVGGKLCEPGDLVLNRLKAHLGVLALSPTHGLVSPDYTVLRPIGTANHRYFCAVYRSPYCGQELRQRAKGIVEGFWRLYTDDFYDIRVPLPPPAEQAAIVRFLDWANGRLERAIRAKRKVIALLNEQKQAIIHRAVTRGLDPSVPLKPSGILWLGDIPQHWEVKKLRFLFQYAKGNRAAELTNEYIGGNPGTFPVYSGQTEDGGLMGSISWHEFEFPFPVVFVSTVGARAMSTRLVQGKFSLSQNCALIIPRIDDVSVEFFENVFQRLFSYERASISLIMQPSLRFADLNRFYICHPPYGEQLEIVKTLSREVAALHTAISRLEREIELLREYRTRLVADVVTGKIDVREAAARLPEEAATDTVEEAADLDDETEPVDEEAAA